MGALLDYGSLLFKPRSAFYTELSGPELHELLSFLVLGIFSVAALGIITMRDKQLREERQMIRRLDEALNTMGKANLGFQSYSSSLELETLKKERKRVSREIHDTVGYSLTNIRIMLEAAGMMMKSDPAGAEELIGKSMNEAGICLEETRAAMRLLRSKETGRPEGLRAFFKLVSAFAEATGISVKVEFGNSPDSFGVRIDRAVFRFIQEGLTNSFRHGRASEIRIYFWIQDRILKLSLQDNGIGTAELKEGIGLTGMKERLAELGGTIRYQNISGGFEVSITIPLANDPKRPSGPARENHQGSGGVLTGHKE
jgi:signal transduction histidine kinase